MIDNKTLVKLQNMDKQDLQIFLDVLIGTVKAIDSENMDGKFSAKAITKVFNRMANGEYDHLRI